MTAYRNHALDLYAIGLLPLPVMDKTPSVFGFNRWRGMKEETVIKLQAQHPTADLALLTRASGLVVVDVDTDDDASLVGWVTDEFGHTPLHVKTRRGYHFYYRNPDKITGQIGKVFPVDLKGAGTSDYVVVPPSKNYSFGQTYLDGRPNDHGDHEFYCYLELIKRIPEINPAGLVTFFPKHPFLNQHPELRAANDNKVILSSETSKVSKLFAQTAPNITQDARRVPPPNLEEGEVISEGERNYWLFNQAMSVSAKLTKKLGTADHVFDMLKQETFSRNRKFCEPPLPYFEVTKLVRNVWFNYELKGKNLKHKSHKEMMVSVEVSEQGIIQGLSNPYAYWLLLWLKSHYGKEQEFGLSKNGLRSLTGLSERKFLSAQKYLRENDYVVQVRPPHKGTHAYYVFTDKSENYFNRITVDVANDNIVQSYAM